MNDTSYRTIQLTQGKVAIVDAADYEALAAFKWYARRDKGTYRARRNYRDPTTGERRTILMHRQILDALPWDEVDHRDGDGLNNRRCNLRWATSAQNSQNEKVRVNNKCGYKGVWFHPYNHNWIAAITANGKKRHLGVFATAEEASAAYIEAAKLLHGEFANW